MDVNVITIKLTNILQYWKKPILFDSNSYHIISQHFPVNTHREDKY